MARPSLSQAFWLERAHPFTPGLAKALVAAGLAFGATLGLRAALEPLSPALIVPLGLVGLVIYATALLVFGLAREERAIFARIPGFRWLDRGAPGPDAGVT